MVIVIFTVQSELSFRQMPCPTMSLTVRLVLFGLTAKPIGMVRKTDFRRRWNLGEDGMGDFTIYKAIQSNDTNP